MGDLEWFYLLDLSSFLLEPRVSIPPEYRVTTVRSYRGDPLLAPLRIAYSFYIIYTYNLLIPVVWNTATFPTCY